jgi:hypothetical protein
VLGHGAVARVKLRHADVMEDEARPAPALREVALSEATRSTLREIADPELRASLESLAQALANADGLPVVR